MTAEVDAESHADIEVFVAIDIPDSDTLGALGHDGIEHLLGGKTETCRSPAIRQDGAIGLREPLRCSATLGITLGQRCQVALLA